MTWLLYKYYVSANYKSKVFDFVALDFYVFESRVRNMYWIYFGRLAFMINGEQDERLEKIDLVDSQCLVV